LYGEGFGVPQDYAEAMRWMRLAAEQGMTSAQYILGTMHAGGYGVLRNDIEAAKWLRLAAEHGQECAQRELGIMFDHGLGVPRDPVQAYMWFSLGIWAGHKDDEQYLQKLAGKMTPEQVKAAERLAREWRPKDPPQDNG
jgi:TPR repeat protein